MKRIIFFTKYTKKGASSRLRSYQFKNFLNSADFDCKYYPLFSDKYLSLLYGRNSKILKLFEAFFCYSCRLIDLFKIKRNDTIFIEKELFPYLPSFFEFFLSHLGFNFIVDFDDAIHHNYDKNNSLVKFFLYKKIPRVMSYATHVIVGNNYLFEYAKKNQILNVTKIPTVIDEKKYYKNIITNKNITIGWIGTPATSFFLNDLLPVFNSLHASYDIKINLVGARKVDFDYEFIDCIDWNESTEVKAIQNFDIGVMPLSDYNSFEKGKCGYKLIQYMACGLPVVASPVGENNYIVENGVNGFLANTNKEWEVCLEKLISDNSLRENFGNQGFKKVQDIYTINKQCPQIIKVVNEIKS